MAPSRARRAMRCGHCSVSCSLSDSRRPARRLRRRRSDSLPAGLDPFERRNAMKTDAVQTALDEDRLERLRTVIRKDVEDQKYDGCSLLVAHRGQIGFHEAFGFSDRGIG